MPGEESHDVRDVVDRLDPGRAGAVRWSVVESVDVAEQDQRIGADDVSAVQLALGSAGVPETFVIDGQGVIRYQHIGEIRPEHVPLLLEKLREAGQ